MLFPQTTLPLPKPVGRRLLGFEAELVWAEKGHAVNGCQAWLTRGGMAWMRMTPMGFE
jgi:hypothetical protein